MTTGIIIATIGFVVSIIALVIALIAKTKENNRLREANELKPHFTWAPRYERFSKFLVVSENLTEYLANNVKRFEGEGYKYDKERSFPTVLCFTKHVLIKDEEDAPSES